MNLWHGIKTIINAGGNRNPLVFSIRPEYMRNMRRALKLLFSPSSVWMYLFPPLSSSNERTGLALVLIAKNEAPYIEEWINFHHKQGVSHFIIYDNESKDKFHEVLKPYIESGLVTYHLLPGRIRQLDAYNMAVHNYGHKFRYMGILDADEFVFVRNNTYGGGGVGMTFTRLLTAS